MQQHMCLIQQYFDCFLDCAPQTATALIGKYWRSWRSYIGSLPFLADFREAMARLSTAGMFCLPRSYQRFTRLWPVS